MVQKKDIDGTCRVKRKSCICSYQNQFSSQNQKLALRFGTYPNLQLEPSFFFYHFAFFSDEVSDALAAETLSAGQ